MSPPNQNQNQKPARVDRLEARVSLEQKHLFQQAANLLGRTLTDFITATLQKESLRVIQEQSVLKLAGQDRKAFIQCLLNPPPPSKRLVEIARRYQKEVKSK